MKSNNKQHKVQKRRWRTRKKVVGSAERPRMSVRFTGKNIYVQFIDDANGHTVASVSSMHKSVEDRDQLKANVASAKEAGIEKVVFDRSGAKYHGKVKALADAARDGGLTF